MEIQSQTSEAQAIASIVKSHSDISAAHGVMENGAGGECMRALPEHFKLHDLEDSAEHRRRARGTFRTTSVASLVRYVKEHREEGASVFVDEAEMRATAVLNLGTHERPGHTDNRAQVDLKKTAAYASLLAIHGSARKQAELAEWMEDWAQHAYMEFFAGDEEVSAKQAVAAVRRITVESVSKLESEEQQLSATRSTFENVTATSREKLPTTIHFACKPYQELPEREFVLRLSVHTGNGAPTLLLRIQNAGLHSDAMAAQLGELIAAGCEDLPVYTGSYEKKA